MVNSTQNPDTLGAQPKPKEDAQPKPPCMAACPAHTDIQGYVYLTAQGRFAEALELLRERCTLPASLGRICHHPCETDCRRGQVEEAVGIRALKRFVADAAADSLPAKGFADGSAAEGSPVQQAAEGMPGSVSSGKTVGIIGGGQSRKTVGIIGGGPAGLTAAADLAKLGHRVTVFEKEEGAGGALFQSIPTYRLPREFLARDVKAIQSLGVEIRTGIQVGKDVTLAQLLNDFDAVLIASGLPISRGLPIPGADASSGIFLALPFLSAVKEGEKPPIGKRVAVIGGGNVAMDVARSARRVGAEEVLLYCLEADCEMPAFSWEIEEAAEEGVEMNCSWGPAEFVVEGGKVKGMTFKRCLSVFDDQGRFSPAFCDEDKKTIEVESVIVSIGQAADLLFLDGSEVKVDERGRLVFDRDNLQASPGVFVAGEVATGPGSAVAAIASGHRAAEAIDAHLTGVPLAAEVDYTPVGELTAEVKQLISLANRQPIEHAPVSVRLTDFREVEQTYSAENALSEAQRCLSCMAGALVEAEKCAACLTCVRVCPFDVPGIGAERVASMPVESCQACGLCATECPAKAITVKTVGGAGIRDRMASAVVDGFDKVALVCQVAHPIEQPSARYVDLGGVALISVLCTGKLDASTMLAPLDLGAESVLVIDCDGDDCRYREGHKVTARNAGVARKVAADVGLGEDKVQFVRVSLSDGEAVKSAVEKFVAGSVELVAD